MLTGAMLLLFVVATEATEAASFEWAGTFETPGAAYVWTAQSSADGLYVDPGMKMVILPTTGTSEDALRSLETGAESAFATTCVDAQVGTVLTPAPGACYQLNFNAKLHTSIFEIDTTGVGAIAVFAEHFPIEFERDMHYFKDVAGEDVEPVAELPAADEPEKPYGEVIGASFLVMVCTLIGVVFFSPIFAQLAKDNMSATMAVMSAFAAGALLACSFYLMLYEATHLIVKPNEADAAAMWGSMILLGFITAPILDFVAQAVIGTGKAEAPTSASRTTDAEEGKETQVTVEAVNTVVTDASSRVRVLCGVLLGDFMHNLVDGVFIGAAFMGCSSSKAWSITAATVWQLVQKRGAMDSCPRAPIPVPTPLLKP